MRVTAASSLPALVLLGAVAGCGQGYPRGEVGAGRLTGAERVALVRKTLAHNASDVRSISLPAPCKLRVQWTDKRETVFPLLQLHTLVDTDPATGDFVVLLQRASSSAPSPLFLATPHWADMAAVRSQLNQLRGSCAARKRRAG